MKRKMETDELRLVALMCVVALHICSGVAEGAEILSRNWLAAWFWRETWAVPVFVMISGSHFLRPDREWNLKTLWSKYILRLAVAFGVWSLGYQLYYFVRGDVDSWKTFCAGLVTGAYHMWFLWMLAGLYAVAPVLQRIAQDRKIAAYYLLLALGVQCWTFFLPLILGLEGLSGQVLEKLHPELVLGFSAYFVLGSVLSRWKPTRRQAALLYIAGILAAVVSTAGDLLLSARAGEGVEHLSRYLSPLTAVQAAAMYGLFARWGERCRHSPAAAKWLEKFGTCGLGAYLSHALILELCKHSPVWAWVTAAPWVGIPLLTLAATAVSILLAMGLRKIPFAGKYIA